MDAAAQLMIGMYFEVSSGLFDSGLNNWDILRSVKWLVRLRSQ